MIQWNGLTVGWAVPTFSLSVNYDESASKVPSMAEIQPDPIISVAKEPYGFREFIGDCCSVVAVLGSIFAVLNAIGNWPYEKYGDRWSVGVVLGITMYAQLISSIIAGLNLIGRTKVKRIRQSVRYCIWSLTLTLVLIVTFGSMMSSKVT